MECNVLETQIEINITNIMVLYDWKLTWIRYIIKKILSMQTNVNAILSVYYLYM